MARYWKVFINDILTIDDNSSASAFSNYRRFETSGAVRDPFPATPYNFKFWNDYWYIDNGIKFPGQYYGGYPVLAGDILAEHFNNFSLWTLSKSTYGALPTINPASWMYINITPGSLGFGVYDWGQARRDFSSPYPSVASFTFEIYHKFTLDQNLEYQQTWTVYDQLMNDIMRFQLRDNNIIYIRTGGTAKEYSHIHSQDTLYKYRIMISPNPIILPPEIPTSELRILGWKTGFSRGGTSHRGQSTTWYRPSATRIKS